MRSSWLVLSLMLFIGTALGAPIIVAGTEHTAALDAALGERYVSEFYGLRPDELMTLYVERALWERFLARAADAAPAAAPCDPTRPGAPDCGPMAAVALWRTARAR